MGLFTKTSGKGWDFDKYDGMLTIYGHLERWFDSPFKKIAKKVRKIKAVEGGSVSNGYSLFADMKNLVSADLTALDVSNCTDMDSMFFGCESLVSLDLSTWNIKNVRTMASMFFFCKKLERVKTGKGWIAENLTDADSMFQGCRKLHEIDLSFLSSSRLEDCLEMFSDCQSLEVLDLSSLSVSKVRSMAFMFSGCDKLRTLKLGGWDTRKAVDMAYMFNECSSLEILDLTGWHINDGTNTNNMFSDLSKQVKVIADDKSVVRLLPEEIKKNVVLGENASADQLLEYADAEWNKDKTDYGKVMELYKKAADRGNRAGAGRIGCMYINGWGTGKNYEEAAKWLLLADENGDKEQAEWLAYFYMNGIGVAKDYEKALPLLQIGAEKQEPWSLCKLGYLYENGYAVRQDPEEALKWYEAAQKAGSKDAPKYIENLKKKAEEKKEKEEEAIKQALAAQAAMEKKDAVEKAAAEKAKKKQKKEASGKQKTANKITVKKPKQQSTPVSSQKADIEDEKAALLEKLAKQQAEVDALKAQLAALQTNKEEKKAAEQKEASTEIAEEKKPSKKAKETTGQKESLPSADKVRAAQDPAQPAVQEAGEDAYNLALMYADGNGDVPKDYLKTLELLCKAADQGHEKAQKILRSLEIHRAKTSYNVPVSHKPNPAEKKKYENKRHIKVAVIGDCLVGKTTLLSALSCYFSQNYPSYENYYVTREEIKEIQSRGAHGLCKEHNYQHEPFYMFLEDPDFLYTFIEIPSVLDFMKNMQQGMYDADIAIYVATVQHGAANGSKYLQLALNAGIPGFIGFQTTLEPNPDQDLINLASFDMIAAAQNLQIPLEQTVDGTRLEYQTDEKDFTICLAELVKTVRDEATALVVNFASDLPMLMSIKKVSRKRDGSLLALGVISRGTLHVGDEVQICGYYDTLIPAICAEIQIFNLSVPCANCGNFVSVRLTDLPPGFVIRAGQFISKPGSITLANSIAIEGDAPTWGDGGRHTPFFTGYHPLLILGPSAVSAEVTDMADELMVVPGTHFKLRLELDKPLPVIHGLRAVLCDGVIVGTGMVTEYSE